MSDITATMLQDKLNSIERNAYDGIDFSQEVTTAYVLADELGERIDQLSAENAKLRDERDRMYKANVEKNGEILRLLEENAKLREFIDLKETCWKYVGWCDECPYNGVDDKHDDCTCMVREKVNSLASELGVEVPE